MNPPWRKNPRRVVTPDRPLAEQPQPDWPDLPKWGAVSPVAQMEDELINVIARVARLEQQFRDLPKQEDVRARRRQR